MLHAMELKLLPFGVFDCFTARRERLLALACVSAGCACSTCSPVPAVFKE